MHCLNYESPQYAVSFTLLTLSLFKVEKLSLAIISPLEVRHRMLQIQSQHEKYRGADKSLARPGRKQATSTEDFDFRISYL